MGSPSFSALRKNRPERDPDEPTEHLARITWMLVTLLSFGSLEYATYHSHFERSSRQFQRDAHHLRQIGKMSGFVVSPRTGGRILLQVKNPKLEWLGAQRGEAAITLRRIAAALGGPVESETRQGIGEGTADMRRGFLHVRAPRPRKGTQIDRVFEMLKGAAKSCARVEFTYTTARGNCSLREAEPYHVIGRNGRYYLVAYDVGRRDWRQFALDAIKDAAIRKVGTFVQRPVPARLLEERAVGWMRGGEAMEVTIRLSPLVAAGVSSCQWQDGQRIVELRGGGAEITFACNDVNEAVRWALGFGTEAVVVAPAKAIAAARDALERMTAAYASDKRLARRLENIA